MDSSARTYFTEVILPCHARMYAAALAITGASDVARDAVQTAMMRIWETVRKGSLPESAMPYCLSAVRNICITEMAYKRRKVPIDTVAEPSTATCRAEKAMELKEVADALRMLPAKERQAVEMSAWGGCSADDIAGALGTNAVNARQLLSRGRKRLRSLFTENKH